MPSFDIRDVDKIRHSAAEEIAAVKDVKALEAVRIKYLGRKDGQLTDILKSLKNLPIAQRRKIGPEANALRQELELEFDKKLNKLQTLSSESRVDITMPGKKVQTGHLHPLTQIEDRIKEIFTGLNFSVVEGPEAETDYYNFDALNILENHPARDMWDTFWLPEKLLLRTHTSPVQIRYMENHRPPFKIIVPGRVFRYEATDASHEINFHQVEGLMVGENVTLANFKYIITEFFRQFFGTGTHVRFRPSYFPFVEPGLEVDVMIHDSLRQPADAIHDSWLEVMGAGMVHPKVLNNVKIDPRKYQGFAFGLGLERLAMIKYKIPDIRLFYSGDLRFINQF